jgi:esterase/lipase superfamily enzyme
VDHGVRRMGQRSNTRPTIQGAVPADIGPDLGGWYREVPLLRHDPGGRTMVFSWPSKAGLFDYAYDRDSAMFSRDGFERVLSSIVSAPSANRVHIVAHSMGTMLALESLRQLYARYGDTVTGRIGAVVFAAPDIDMDVFSSAISRIGPLAGKITVIASTNDRALALSGRLAGGMTRVGAAEKAAIERLGVRVIDASDTGWGIINHDLFLSNEEVQRVI